SQSAAYVRSDVAPEDVSEMHALRSRVLDTRLPEPSYAISTLTLSLLQLCVFSSTFPDLLSILNSTGIPLQS
ncbi:hypothetical protein, partial [Fibrobacter sp. UWH1]|uniref:hypothetical protein n=1 Tax=Fibrobacter sp. UWH1 TaxID=1964354 RepID=UPI001C3CC2E9